MRDKPTVPTFEPEVVQAETRRRGGDPDKVATTSLKEMTVAGVRLTSRYGKAREYEAMAAMVGSLSPALARETAAIFCDSKQGADFTVDLHRWHETTARAIGARMERACVEAIDYFTAITIRCGDRSFDIEQSEPDDEETDA